MIEYTLQSSGPDQKTDQQWQCWEFSRTAFSVGPIVTNIREGECIFSFRIFFWLQGPAPMANWLRPRQAICCSISPRPPSEPKIQSSLFYWIRCPRHFCSQSLSPLNRWKLCWIFIFLPSRTNISLFSPPLPHTCSLCHCCLYWKMCNPPSMMRKLLPKMFYQFQEGHRVKFLSMVSSIL